MIYLIVILIVLVVFAAVYGILAQIGFLEPPGGSGSSPSSSSYSGGYTAGGRTGTGTGTGFQIPHFGELPYGCLLAVILASFVWFVAWAIVLVLALRIISSPLG